MKNVIIKILAGATVILLVGCLIFGRQLQRLRDDNRRLSGNQVALLSENREYKVRDSLNALSVQILQLEKKEFKAHFAELNSLVRDMGVKISRLESISQSSTETRYEVVTPVRDTTVLNVADSTHRPAQSLFYRDTWLTLDGIILDRQFRGSIVTYDTLTQLVHRVPKRFLFIKYGIKELRQEIVSSNPHTRLTYSEVIKISR